MNIEITAKSNQNIFDIKNKLDSSLDGLLEFMITNNAFKISDIYNISYKSNTSFINSTDYCTSTLKKDNDPFLLQENRFYLLQQNGKKIKLI